MERECKNCDQQFDASKLLVFVDGTFLCDGCVPKTTRDPVVINLQLYWYEALALEKLLQGELDLELMEIRDNILRDLGQTIHKILKRLVPSNEKGNVQKPDSKSMGS